MSEFLHEHLRDAPVMADRAPWTLPDQALTFRDASEIQPTLSASGNHWLDPSTQAAHGHRLDPQLQDVRFFVVETTSYIQRERQYTVHWASRAPGDDHISVHRFDDVLPTRAAAHTLAVGAAADLHAGNSPALAGAAARPAQQITAPTVPREMPRFGFTRGGQ